LHHGISLKNCADLSPAYNAVVSGRRPPVCWMSDRHAAVADRSFATAACPRIWNGLPEDVTSATSLLTFPRKLKAHLFRQSYTDFILCLCVIRRSGPCIFTQAAINSL